MSGTSTGFRPQHTDPASPSAGRDEHRHPPVRLAKFRWTDLRLGGTGVPGTLAVGRFWMGSPHRWVFLDLRRSSKEVLVLELQDYRYDAVMVEVDDIARVLEMIRLGRLQVTLAKFNK